MSYKGSSPRTLDLFEYTLTIPTPSSEPVPARLPALASLSDTELAQRLGQLLEEVQRRLEKGSRPELETAARQVRLALKRSIPSHAEQDRPSRRSSRTSPVLQEGQRKAVRAALLAGVAPPQVARHFGLPLATVRKVLNEPA